MQWCGDTRSDAVAEDYCSDRAGNEAGMVWAELWPNPRSYKRQ